MLSLSKNSPAWGIEWARGIREPEGDYGAQSHLQFGCRIALVNGDFNKTRASGQGELFPGPDPAIGLLD